MAPAKHPDKGVIVDEAIRATSLLKRAEFRLSVETLQGLPSGSQAEVAFAGRSNVGKSSALNALTGRRQLARVSKTPGRTRQINFFELAPAVFLVDLPGYGYARVPGETKRRWSDLLSNYLCSRDQLVGLVVVMDVRHPLTDLDRQMLEWFRPTGKPIHLLLTKADKLSRSQAQAQLKQIRAAIDRRYAGCTVQLFSSRSKLGIEQAESTIDRWLGDHGAGHDSVNKKPPVKGELNRGRTRLN